MAADCPDCETDIFVEAKPVPAEVYRCHFCSADFEPETTASHSFLSEQ
jgi:DNA-directed RNA polymerase subunit RPC12/RpoP